MAVEAVDERRRSIGMWGEFGGFLEGVVVTGRDRALIDEEQGAGVEVVPVLDLEPVQDLLQTDQERVHHVGSNGVVHVEERG